MNTENDYWRDSSGEEQREGNRDGNRDSYGNYQNSNNRSSYNREGRPQRPRIVRDNNNSGGEQRSSYNRYDRPQRSYNREEGEGSSYNRDNRSSSYNRDNRSSSYNREGGGYSSYNNREGGGERPYRPRFNRENDGGDQRSSYNRPQRSYNNNGDRSYNNNNGGSRYNNGGGERRTWNNNNEGGDDRPRFRRPMTNSGYSNNNSSYNRGGGDNRSSFRPRYNNQGPGNRSQGFARPVRRNDDYDPNAKYTRKKQIEYKEQFVDPNEPIRLNKFLANAGVCSRREADEFITAGVVSVNGEVVTELGTKIKRADEVKFHEEIVSIERKVYILLNKPKDCVTTSDDPQSRRTVMELVKGACNERIYPVGRLDRNTTGVLLLTNDGDLASKLTHPQFLKKKIYQVQTDKNVTKAHLDEIAAGIKLEDGTEITADAVSYADPAKRNVIGIEIHSGQNRIVRRIFEALGYKVVKLDRVYFAGLTKKGLRRGDWRYLSENEVNYLRMGSFN